MGQATFTSDNPQVIVGQSRGELKEELQELMQELPQIGAAMMEMRQMEGMQRPYINIAPQPMRRRRRGCGCGGCISLLVFLIIFGAVGLGILASVSPTTVAALIANIPGLEDLKSAITTPPVISTFTVSPTTITSGDVVTVKWSTNGDSVRLEQINTKNPQAALTLPSSGTRLFTVTGSGLVTFKLTAIKNGVESTTPQTKTVTVKSPSR